MNSPSVVLKFGSSVLRDESCLPSAVAEIYRHLRAGRRVVAVVSALGSTTDELLARAHAVDPEPEPRRLASLLASGEHVAAELLGLALERSGIPALPVSTRCLRVEGDVLDAEPVALDAAPLAAALAAGAVAILPGFSGFDADGTECLLGRGGSDLSALFVAQRLGADCVLLKDVPGLFERDPASADGGAPPRRYAGIRFEDALGLSCRVVQPKALEFARAHGHAFEVAALGGERGTRVGAPSSELERPALEVLRAPRRVALLGCGAVGGGVLAGLASLSDELRVVRVLVRDVEHHARAGVPRELLTDDLDEVFAARPEVVVELLGGLEPAGAAIARALGAGLDVVTANKALLADRGDVLRACADERGARLLDSASVGGVLPALETVRRAVAAGGVVELQGVLNGTANFVLERMAGGASLDDAVREAQLRGLAEADPTLDLDGSDVAHKLQLLAREAFGPLELDWTARDDLRALDPDAPRVARERGAALRLVGACRLAEHGPVASVRLVELPADHAFGALRGEENALLVRRRDGSLAHLRGKGAGRWPTAEAVLADLRELGHGESAAESRAARAS